MESAAPGRLGLLRHALDRREEALVFPAIGAGAVDGNLDAVAALVLLRFHALQDDAAAIVDQRSATDVQRRQFTQMATRDLAHFELLQHISQRVVFVALTAILILPKAARWQQSQAQQQQHPAPASRGAHGAAPAASVASIAQAAAVGTITATGTTAL